MAIVRTQQRSNESAYKLDKVGTDTEVFLRDAAGKPVPVIGLIGGTKHKPKPVSELGKGFCVQEDNVMLEYNVPPAKTKEQFVNNIMTMNSYLQTLLAGKNLQMDICSSMKFSPKQLDHPQALDIGCEPDFDVWKRLINPSPKEHPLIMTTRTAGGHLHVSFTHKGKYPEDIFVKEPIVKALDLTIGVPSLILDQDQARRELYGRPGAFRPKDYGIEYRTVSNFWTRTPEMIAWAFDGIVKAISICNRYSKLLENESSHIRECFSFPAKETKRRFEYVSYLMGVFGMPERVPGHVLVPNANPMVTW